MSEESGEGQDVCQGCGYPVDRIQVCYNPRPGCVKAAFVPGGSARRIVEGVIIDGPES
jgi:hypothetical protein